MAPNKQNRPDSHEVQPVKTLTKYATDFIARCTLFASGFYFEKGIDVGLLLTFVLVLLQAVLMAAWGTL
jgi:hypothetical protein